MKRTDMSINRIVMWVVVAGYVVVTVLCRSISSLAVISSRSTRKQRQRWIVWLFVPNLKKPNPFRRHPTPHSVIPSLCRATKWNT